MDSHLNEDLSLLNRRFASIIRSPQFLTKPVLRIGWACFQRPRCKDCRSRESGCDGFAKVNVRIDFREKYVRVDLDSILRQKWVRFNSKCMARLEGHVFRHQLQPTVNI